MRLVITLLVCLATFTGAQAFDAFGLTGIDARPGAQIPLDGAFRDESGRTVTLRELADGKVLLLVPVLHTCPNICGVTLGGLAAALSAQPYVAGRDYVLVAFGIDPAEQPAAAAASLAALRLRAPNLGAHALTGTADDIAAVTQALGYRYAFDDTIGQYSHMAATAILAPDGRLTRWIYGIAPEPGDLRLAITEAGQGRIGGFAEQLLLLCYHYDAASGRYAPMIWMALRVGGGLTVLSLALFVGGAIRRDRNRPA